MLPCAFVCAVLKLETEFYWFSELLNMQSIRNSILWHVRVGSSAEKWLLTERGNVLKSLSRHMCAATGTTSTDQIMDRVIGLVKKFDKIDASKVVISFLLL